MDLETLMGLGVTDDDRMRALADSLRGRRQAADVFSMSTIQPLSQAARGEQAQIQATAEGIGALRRARQQEADRTARETAAQAAREAEAVREREFEASESALDRANRLKIAQQRARNAGAGIKPTGTEHRNYTGAINLRGQISSANEAFEALDEGQREQLDQPGSEIALKAAQTVLPEGVSRKAEEDIVYTDPDVRKYRTKIGRLEGDLSKLASGLAVTGFEMQDRKRWSPFAEGISQEERQNRLLNIDELLEREIGTFEAYYPEFTMPEMESAEEDQVYEPQTDEDYAAIPSGAIFVDPDDGKTYRKP